MPDNTILLENVEIIFRNFTGREGMYNREGDRNFAIKLDQERADILAREGWNVKTLRAREEDELPQPYLSVSVGYKGRPPVIKMMTSRGSTFLDEETVSTLDDIDIQRADLMIRPYDWAVSGNTGRKAYLQSLYIIVNEDPLALKYGGIADVSGPMMEMTGPYVPSDEVKFFMAGPPITREKAEKFLDELASAAYELRTKYGIPQEDFVFAPTVRIYEYVNHGDSFKNVSNQG